MYERHVAMSERIQANLAWAREVRRRTKEVREQMAPVLHELGETRAESNRLRCEASETDAKCTDARRENWIG